MPTSEKITVVGSRRSIVIPQAAWQRTVHALHSQPHVAARDSKQFRGFLSSDLGDANIDSIKTLTKDVWKIINMYTGEWKHLC